MISMLSQGMELDSAGQSLDALRGGKEGLEGCLGLWKRSTGFSPSKRQEHLRSVLVRFNERKTWCSFTTKGTEHRRNAADRGGRPV